MRRFHRRELLARMEEEGPWPYLPASPLRGRLSLALSAIVVAASTTASYPLSGKSSIVQPDCVTGRYAARRLSICSHGRWCERVRQAAIVQMRTDAATHAQRRENHLGQHHVFAWSFRPGRRALMPAGLLHGAVERLRTRDPERDGLDRSRPRYRWQCRGSECLHRPSATGQGRAIVRTIACPCSRHTACQCHCGQVLPVSAPVAAVTTEVAPTVGVVLRRR
jgi:hypothetical protein